MDYKEKYEKALETARLLVSDKIFVYQNGTEENRKKKTISNMLDKNKLNADRLSLYADIDKTIGDLVSARLSHDTQNEVDKRAAACS